MKCTLEKENSSLSFLFSLFLKYEKAHLNRILKPYNITMRHTHLLIILTNTDDFMLQKDLTGKLHLDSALVTRDLRTLEAEGLIERVEDDENRRQNKIKLTSKGRELAEFVYKKEIEYENKILEDTTSRKTIMELLTSIIERTKSYDKKEREEQLDRKN